VELAQFAYSLKLRGEGSYRPGKKSPLKEGGNEAAVSCINCSAMCTFLGACKAGVTRLGRTYRVPKGKD